MEGQTTQWPKEKCKRTYNQRHTKHIYATKDLVTRTKLNASGERRCARRVSSSCVIGATCSVNLFTNPVISNERRKDQAVFTTNGTYPLSFMTHIFHRGQQSHGGDRATFEVMTSTYKDEI